ncbi:MAG: GSCFA domain-containing protein, partial [Acidobacteriota bacterium]
MTHVTLIGSCHALGMAQVMTAIGRTVTATAIVPTPDNRARLLGGDYDALFASSHRILVQPGGFQRIDGTGSGRYTPHDSDDPVAEAEAYVRRRCPAVPIGRFPKILFSAFHPDFDFVRDRSGTRFDGPCGHHSALVFYAWQRGMSARAAAELFTPDVFARVGYFDYWAAAAAFLVEESRAANVELEPFIPNWTARGVWMYSFNHPRLYVLSDVARALMERDGLAIDAEALPPNDDALARQTVFPVYPALAERLGVPGGYRFQLARAPESPDIEPPVLDLPQFIDACYAAYAGHAPGDLVCRRLESPRYADLQRRVNTRARGTVSGTSPYDGLPDRQFWRHAMSAGPGEDVDPAPVVAPMVSRHDRVATAGSCFAQHISRALTAAGFHYLVTEPGPGLSAAEASRRGFGVFSARFGNIYSACQLRQLFERAFGTCVPAEGAWTRADGRLVDAFRPRVEPDGFATLADLERSRESHLAAVREMFEQLDVLVFTLGLTEMWRSRLDGAVYPLAPGVAGGTFDPARHEFVNATVAEIVADLRQFIAGLGARNPRARLILTVSPVPLAATYEHQHVLVATAYSKAVLRVAAEEVCRAERACTYFPSFEIITGPHADGR